MSSIDFNELDKRLHRYGWTAEGYVRLNPDVAELNPAQLAEHFLVHGIREHRAYSDATHCHFNIERIAASSQDFLLYGWSQDEIDDIGVLVVKEANGSFEYEFVDTAPLWYWRDDVARHLDVAPKTKRHGLVLAGRVATLNPAGAKVYVFAGGRVIEFPQPYEARLTTQQAMLECYQLMQAQHVHDELSFLLSKYPNFLDHVGRLHSETMLRQPVREVFSAPNPDAAYSICAVVLGNPQLLKVWLMGLPDLHDLRNCEVNILCNGTDSFEMIEQTARWFADVLGGRIRLYSSSENLGFNVAVNWLVAAAKTDYAMVTNIDVQYRRFDFGHLKMLCSSGTTICAARQFNGMGAVQHLGLHIELKQQMVHGETFESVESSLHGRNTYLAADAPLDVEVDFFGAACFFAKRDLLQSLGPFSTRYIYAYHEDSDLAIRARGAGVKLVVTGALDLVHFESSGAKGDLPKAFFIAANAARLAELLRADRKAEKTVPPIATRQRKDVEPAGGAVRRRSASGSAAASYVK